MTHQLEMRKELLRYFAAERQESAVFMLVGVAALIVAILLLRGGSPWRAMAFPLALIAVIQVVVGATVFLRTPRQVKNLEARLESSVQDYRAAEVPRMRQVMRSFVIYRWIEIALLITGIVLMSTRPVGTTWSAVGLGLALQSGLMLLLDFFAERRGAVYLGHLRRLS